MDGNDTDIVGTVHDPLTEARQLAEGASAEGIQLRLLGGLAVRVLCPTFPPRLRRNQDIDFGCLSKGRKAVVAYLESAGCEPDRRFNSLNGDRQMYFNAPSGRPIDVMVDQLNMCHVLDFRPRFHAMPITLDVADLLLTKLQIIEMNEKDAHDITHLLSAYQIVEQKSDESGVDADRFAKVLGSDWGWWRTVTDNLVKLPKLLDEHPHLVPDTAPYDARDNAEKLHELAHSAPKSMQWKMRAKVGDRMRWYELPEEVDH